MFAVPNSLSLKPIPPFRRCLACPALLHGLALTAFVGGGACADPDIAVVARLVGSQPDAVERFDPRTQLTLESTWLARISGPADVAAWSFEVPAAAARLAPSSAGIDLAPLRDSRYLVWRGPLDARGVDVLRFRFREPVAGLAELYWNGAGEDFAPQRYLLQGPDPEDPRQVVFDVSGVRTWRGTVTRIGLRLLPQPAPGQALVQGEGLRYVAREEVGQGETRYVALDGRSMPAWLVRPGTTLRRRLSVPRRARLWLHVAPFLPEGDAVRIRVVAHHRQGDQVLIDRELARRADPPRWRWTELEADLGPFAGEAIELRFVAGPAPRGSLVAWGNPLLVGTADERRPNVVFLSLDTVRADHLSVYGYRRPTTPGLAAWARRWATVFETTVASAPWTLPSHVSMLSGIDAVHHGVNRHGPIPPALTLLPQRLRDAGYATYATTAGVLLTPELGFERGFDEFSVRGKMESLPEWDAELGDGITDALRWLMTHRGERFFLFFHTYEAHAPYQAREPYFSQFGGDRKALNAGLPVWMEEAGFEAMVRPRSALFHPPTYAEGVTYSKRVLQAGDRRLAAALYDSGLAYIDRQVSRLLEYLESEDLLENTVVVVTSDHGESLFEHGLVGHSSLYDHDLLVPLIVAAPIATARGGRVRAQVRSVDIAPTLLQLAGLKPANAIDGRSLVPFLRGEAAAARNAWSYALSTTRGISLRTAERPRKVIAQDTAFDPFRQALEVYDLRRDPAELHNLGGGAAADRLRQALRAAVTPGRGALQIRVANAGPGEISGGLRGPAIDAMVTSADLSYSCCTVSPEGVRFTAPAGKSFTLTLQDWSGAILRLELASAGQLWTGSFPVGSTPPRLRIVFQGGRWQADGAATGESWTGVEILRPRSLSRSPADEEQVRRGLRALGYIR